MKKLYKMTIILAIIISLGQVCNNVYAAETPDVSTQKDADYSKADEALNKKKAEQDAAKRKSAFDVAEGMYLDDWDPSKQQEDDETIKYKAKIIIGVIRGIGIVVSIISLMIIGFREMTASVEEKSIIKQAMPGYILGVIMVAAITLIPTIIYEWAQKL